MFAVGLPHREFLMMVGATDQEGVPRARQPRLLVGPRTLRGRLASGLAGSLRLWLAEMGPPARPGGDGLSSCGKNCEWEMPP